MPDVVHDPHTLAGAAVGAVAVLGTGAAALRGLTPPVAAAGADTLHIHPRWLLNHRQHSSASWVSWTFGHCLTVQCLFTCVQMKLEKNIRQVKTDGW